MIIRLLPKNFDVIVVGKGNGVVAGGFQRAELLASSFGLGQHGHVIVGTQGLGLGQHGGKVGVFR